MIRTIEVSNPPLFIIVSGGPDGKVWLNAHRILSMREEGPRTYIEMDNGETFHVAEKAALIAKSVERPSVTIVANSPDGKPQSRTSKAK